MRVALIVGALVVLGATLSFAQPAPQAATLPPPYNTANIEAGRQAFAACASCHSLVAGEERLGPDLHALIGRRAGSVQSFNYSDAFASANFAWDGQHLDDWLKDPAGYLPDNQMFYDGMADANERRDLIAYLMVAKGD